jgi:hypothetical protein
MPFRTLFSHENYQAFSFQQLPHSFHHHGGYTPLLRQSPNRLGKSGCASAHLRHRKFFRCNTYKKQGVGSPCLSTFRRLDVATFRRSVLLRTAIAGATISPGATILRLPGKQLRSPRCLRILSGHRDRLAAVPSYIPALAGIASQAWVYRSNYGFQGLYLLALS